jgi:hypothetical protein
LYGSGSQTGRAAADGVVHAEPQTQQRAGERAMSATIARVAAGSSAGGQSLCRSTFVPMMKAADLGRAMAGPSSGALTGRDWG